MLLLNRKEKIGRLYVSISRQETQPIYLIELNQWIKCHLLATSKMLSVGIYRQLKLNPYISYNYNFYISIFNSSLLEDKNKVVN